MVIQEAASAGVEVMWLSTVGMKRLVADDRHIDAFRLAAAEEIEHPGKRFCEIHSGPVNVALKLGPLVLAAADAKVVAYGLLRLRQVDGHELALGGERVKGSVVADDRVVEVDPDSHLGLGA